MATKQSNRKISKSARSAMSRGGSAAQRARWGAERAPGKSIRIDADIADRLMRTVEPADRRAFCTLAIQEALDARINP